MARSSNTRSQVGQSTAETMLVMSFLALFIAGAIHLSMFAVTRSMVNLAAFGAARTLMVQEDAVELPVFGGIDLDLPINWRLQLGWPAAYQVLDGLRWWNNPWLDRPEPIRETTHRGRTSLYVTYRVPFGLPIFNDVPNRGLRVRGFATYVIQDVAEEGDNAR